MSCVQLAKSLEFLRINWSIKLETSTGKFLDSDDSGDKGLLLRQFIELSLVLLKEVQLTISIELSTSSHSLNIDAFNSKRLSSNLGVPKTTQAVPVFPGISYVPCLPSSLNLRFSGRHCVPSPLLQWHSRARCSPDPDRRSAWPTLRVMGSSLGWSGDKNP